MKKNDLAKDKNTLYAECISKSYNNRTVVNGVSIYVKPGEIVGILGPNGSGKTTTFDAIMGSIEIEKGRIYIDGKNITKMPIYKRARLGLGYLPQETSIFRGMNVENNLLAVIELYEKDKQKVNETLDNMLKEFNIEHIRHSPSVVLSGGERRRLEVARALCAGPKYMLFDEPFAGVDPIAVRDLKELIISLKKRGLGIIITDHNVRETLDLIDRGYILYMSNLIAEGKPAKLIKDEKVRDVYLGDSIK